MGQWKQHLCCRSREHNLMLQKHYILRRDNRRWLVTQSITHVTCAQLWNFMLGIELWTLFPPPSSTPSQQVWGVLSIKRRWKRGASSAWGCCCVFRLQKLTRGYIQCGYTQITNCHHLLTSSSSGTALSDVESGPWTNYRSPLPPIMNGRNHHCYSHT